MEIFPSKKGKLLHLGRWVRHVTQQAAHRHYQKYSISSFHGTWSRQLFILNKPWFLESLKMWNKSTTIKNVPNSYNNLTFPIGDKCYPLPKITNIYSIYIYGCDRDGCRFPLINEELAEQITHSQRNSRTDKQSYLLLNTLRSIFLRNNSNYGRSDIFLSILNQGNVNNLL